MASFLMISGLMIWFLTMLNSLARLLDRPWQ
jgi:hypothetical protein